MTIRASRRLRDDDGSILPLICFYAALGLVVVLLVGAATSLYLERKRLLTLADGAALAGAESFGGTGVTLVDGVPRVELSEASVRRAVDDYLAAAAAAGFDDLRLDRATTPDGRSAAVTMSSLWHPPLVTAFVPDGIRIDATAVSRTVLR